MTEQPGRPRPSTPNPGVPEKAERTARRARRRSKRKTEQTGQTVRDVMIDNRLDLDQQTFLCVSLGLDLDMPVETMRRRLLWGERVERYEPRDPGSGNYGSLAGPPEDWYRFLLGWLRRTNPDAWTPDAASAVASLSSLTSDPEPE